MLQEQKRTIESLRSFNHWTNQLEEMWDYRTLNGTPQRAAAPRNSGPIFNHETHHRGQAHAILTMVGRRGAKPLDLLIMQRDKS